MNYPAWGTVPIECGKRACKWTGYETDLKPRPHKTLPNVDVKCCPVCGCESYYFIESSKKGRNQ